MHAMPNATIMSYKGKTPTFGKNVLVASGACAIGDLTLGENASIWFNAVVRADEHWIKIGKGSNIQDNSVVHITHRSAPTTIGDYVTVGHNAIIHGCTIDDYCLIGMGAIILDHAHIKERTLVGAGALIAPGKTYPPGVLLVGNPARVARQLTEKELAYFEYSANHYIEVAGNYIEILRHNPAIK